MEGNYSLSDLAAVTNGDGFGGMGNGNLLILIVLFLLFGGGFNRGSGDAATQADIQRAVDFSSIQAGQAGISSEIQRGIYEINNNTGHVAYDNLGEIRDVQAAVATGNANVINNLTALQANMQNCCCTTQRAIDGVNYNLASQSAAIQANDTANTQKILDAIAGNRIADMQSQINALQLQNAVCGVVRYPNASTYNAGLSPFGNTCGCGNI